MPRAATPTEDIITSCSFCGKPVNEVARTVAGPGVLICNERVGLSATIIADAAPTTPEEPARRHRQYLDRPAEEILAMLPALIRSAARVDAERAGWAPRLREQGTDWPTVARVLETGVEAARQRFDTEPPT